MLMDIVLLERVPSLGQMGDVVKVKPGYARNYLLPQKKALRANKANLAQFEKQRAQLEAMNLERRREAESVASKIDGMTVTLIRQAGDSGQLYGSVSVRDLAEAMQAGGVSVDRRQVQLGQPIKMLGLHTVTVNLHPEVAISVVANVARTEDEAARQARGENVNAPVEEERDFELGAGLEEFLGGAPERDDDNA
ncbi:50S ribosomal protein L9 [Constrictibacter sp. MBR-5]|uniref:50S ribosomal protein L9 n=1 Tax=Constrictibacter sp. MBR-5 TaxID=3156467 RepID=UPI0033973CF4